LHGIDEIKIGAVDKNKSVIVANIIMVKFDENKI
jgi:hypothetical protein